MKYKYFGYLIDVSRLHCLISGTESKGKNWINLYLKFFY